jgi:hypothetical protein
LELSRDSLSRRYGNDAIKPDDAHAGTDPPAGLQVAGKLLLHALGPPRQTIPPDRWRAQLITNEQLICSREPITGFSGRGNGLSGKHQCSTKRGHNCFGRPTGPAITSE